ncbi:MAG: 1,4-dihydroxy-2-naphthoate octaprenyltransferase [Bacteroidales bacterium]|nr:1,4-dihydroxy-2-naphthoate octaprenyltransferase [Bacteroidales bacterium]
MDKPRTNGLRAWWMASRPKTLAGAAAPVLVGCSLACRAGSFALLPSLVCLLFALLMQIDANLINDYFDCVKGADSEDRVGPRRACAQGWVTLPAMRLGMNIVSVVAVAVGSCVLFFTDWLLVPVGGLCVVFALAYTAGPYPLAYHGWGDVLVVVFFGVVPVCCTYYVLTATCTLPVLTASVACGLVTDQLLMVNNFRDRDQDAVSGKRTIVVRWGAQWGLWAYLALGVAAVALSLRLTALTLLFLPPHVRTWVRMRAIGGGAALNGILGETARNILVFSLLFSIGIVLT